MNYDEEIIKTVLEKGPVRVDTTWSKIESDRKALQAAALKVTAEPIEFAVRTDTQTFQQYILVSKFDKTKTVPYEKVEKEAIEKGWIPKIL